MAVYGVSNGPTDWLQVNVFDDFFINTASSDFNGDGITDILWRRDPSLLEEGDPGEVAIWTMNGASIIGGGFLPAAPRGTDEPVDWDLAFSFGDWSSYIPFGEYGQFLTEGFPVQKLDFDGNGTSDIIWRTTDGSEIAIWNMQGATIINGAFLQGAPRTELGEDPLDWTLRPGADFNGDGKTDIFWRKNPFSADDNAGEIATWIMDGPNIVDGGFLQSAPRTEDDPSDWDFEFADFNGDSKTDLFWRKDPASEDDNAGEIATWIMDGPNIVDGGFLQSAPRTEDDPSEWDFEFADFNGDSKTDIFWRKNPFSADDNAGEIATWIMDGPNIVNGGFLQSAPRTEDDPSDWNFEFADFNGDGKTDIFWRKNPFSADDNAGEVAIWIMDGPNIVDGGFLQSSARTEDDASEWDFEFGDFNGDGKTDIFWNKDNADPLMSENAIWIMDGKDIVDGGFLQGDARVGQEGWGYEFRELDGNGTTDLYWTNDMTGEKAAWLMNGSDIIGGGFLPQFNPTNEILMG